MTDFGWVVTKDHLADPKYKAPSNMNAKGMIGPSDATLKTVDAIKTDPAARRFRMYDDDGELYYEGFCVEGPEWDGFEPLEHFGSPNAGCTRIDYLEDGRWQTL